MTEENKSDTLPQEGEVIEKGDEEENIETSDASEEASYSGPLNLKLPADEDILKETHRLASERTFRVHDLATCTEQDPVLVLELLRLANSLYYIQGRPAITTAEAAIVHLGSEQLLEVISTLEARQNFSDPDQCKSFESLRQKAQKISAIARVLALTTNKKLAAEVHSIGLMSVMGQMMACAYLGQDYVDLAASTSRSSLAYKLGNSFNFDLNTMQLAYLRKNGFPEVLLFALDRDASSKTPHRAGLRFLLHAAIELVDAFEEGKISRYEPGNNLPTQSALRLLQLDDIQYKSMWEHCYPTLTFVQTERQNPCENTEPTAAPAEPTVIQEAPSEPTKTQEQASVTKDTASEELFYDDITASEELTYDDIIDNAQIQTLLNETSTEQNNQSTSASYNSPDLENRSASRSASHSASTPSRDKKVVHPFTPAPPPIEFIKADKVEIDSISGYARCSTRIAHTISEFAKICDSADTTIQLLEMLLNFLVTDGPFVRAALLVHAKNRGSAEVFRSIGNGFANGDYIAVPDPMSPLASCLTQVKSFNAHDLLDEQAPLGISSYALSPLDVKHDVPVSLYADCGEEASITFEARRIFRYVVGLLNAKLPEVEGSVIETSRKLEATS